MKLWHELENLHIPIGRVVVIVAVVVTAYVWADDLQDAQTTTQVQLDQLVKIVTKGAEERHAADKTHDDALTSIEKSLALIVQEAELRREFESNRTAAPPPVE